MGGIGVRQVQSCVFEGRSKAHEAFADVLQHVGILVVRQDTQHLACSSSLEDEASLEILGRIGL